MTDHQIISIFSIDNTEITMDDGAESIILEYMDVVLSFLSELYDEIEENESGEYEPVSEKEKIIRTMKDIKESLGKYKKIPKDDDLIKNKENCSICYNEYKVGEYKRELCCNHTFHKKCIDKWFIKNNNCPICRNEIFK